MLAGQFLTELWGERPPGQVLVWRMPGKKSVWFNDLSKVNTDGWVDEEVYFGAGLAAPLPKKFKATERVKAENIIGIAALWADVDIKGLGHQKPNLPETYEAAYELLDQMPLAPTIIINSGHGLQPWWIFEEPWIFADEAERKQAAEITKWWHGKLKEIAAPLDIDAVHDLARVMRLPGTFNNKTDPVVPVTVEREDGPRYSVSEIRALYASEGVPEAISEPAWGRRLDVESGVFPFRLWQALMDNEPKFKRSWNRTRTDLTDQSQSSYDMSLASIAASAGWTDQEIADLLIAHRKIHGSPDDPKLTREDYYRRTIARAQEPMVEAGAQRALEDLLDDNSGADATMAALS